MEWISIKDRLPNEEQTVLIKLKYKEPYMCVARFYGDLITFRCDYKHIFITIPHPRFPKTWLFTDEYKKISYIVKNKVTHWMPLPKASEK